jgi:agmatinase
MVFTERKEYMVSLDPSVTASHKVGIFGIPTTVETAKVILIPVPWEVTTSYGSGTSDGPLAILEASPQIDLFDLELGKSYEQGYHLLPLPQPLMEANRALKAKAQQVREALEERGELSSAEKKLVDEVNQGCAQMSEWVYSTAQKHIAQGKMVGVIGGDHSSPEGLIRAVCEQYAGDVGVLHIDAHADLRNAYQGFTRSHASIMFNVMHAPWKPKQLVQVGIRDFSEEEYRLSEERKDIAVFYDGKLKQNKFKGATWASLCEIIVGQLPKKVYVSFDIDGLDRAFCPHTGTPVPGGLTFDEANFLLSQVVESGRTIVGFDLNEVAPGPDGDEWDANVGARMLYKLCGYAVR